MISDKVQCKINRMNFKKLEKISDWLWKRYKNNQLPPIARYITKRFITKLRNWQEEVKAGLL